MTKDDVKNIAMGDSCRLTNYSNELDIIPEMYKFADELLKQFVSEALGATNALLVTYPFMSPEWYAVSKAQIEILKIRPKDLVEQPEGGLW